MSNDTFHGHGKEVSLYEKGQIMGMHQAGRVSKEIRKTTKIGLRTVHVLSLITGRKVGNHRLQGTNVVDIQNLNDQEQ